MIVYGVNSYVLALLKKKQGWSKIGSVEPMLPAQQQPEAMNTTKPFAIYTSSTEFLGSEIEVEDSEVISYVVYSNEQNRVIDAITELKNAFKAGDSANNINAWIQNPSNQMVNNDDRSLSVKWTRVMDAETPGGTTSEGGKMAGFITVRVAFTSSPGNYSI